MDWVRMETSGGAPLCRAEVADGWWNRFWGLMGRRELPEGVGLWIKPSSSVHTSFMRFAIDLVYLSPANEVVKITKRLRPWRFSSGGRNALTVLELPPGTLDRIELRIGEKLTVTPVEGPPPSSTEPPGPPSADQGEAAQ